ncbi:MAG: sensor histidine kinase [Intestinibacillus sp.]
MLTHLISQRLSRPIHLVAHAMQNFDTNRSRRFPEDRSDEIGVLYHSFNRMMSHIDILFSEVRETAGRQRQSELQAQINPHFLYNTLDCIKSFACLHDNSDIVHLTTALSDFLRVNPNCGSETLLDRTVIKLIL